ncbi:MAG: hypothetical protein H0V06_04440 [Gemmatimonadetes bacterium]|nr:hypothetical protein [Gemmatimonadota bacterium]
MRAAPITLRADFNPLALWEPGVRTDANGRAQAPVRIPGSLTRYRVMAVAVSGARHFGVGEAAITARQGLMVRPSPPRFLRFGDRFELPVVVQNSTGAPMQVELAVRATGLEVDNVGRRVTVPAGDRVEVHFPGRATRAGTARVQIAATAGARSDAAQMELPVYTPATAEAFATYGVIDTGAVRLPFAAPGNVLPGFGGLEIGFSSTAVIELTDAYLYLQSYPFEGAEHIASRVLANAALRDVLTAFRTAGVPDSATLAGSMQRDIQRIAALQNPDGGWNFWRRGEESWPYVSIHVAHALERARAKGYAVPQETLARASSYLRDIERRIPALYGPQYRRSLVAYALYVRDRMGEAAASVEARRRVAEWTPAGMPLEAAGWLLSVLADDPAAQAERQALLRHINNRATETAAAAHFVSRYEESKQAELLLLHSDRRTDGVLLEALIAADPRSDLIPKVARGLLAHRVRGRWASTQENAWALLALDRYFATYERTVPDFVARAWLGDRLAAQSAFQGRTTERSETLVPMRVLVSGDAPREVTLGKEGAGRMYYRAGLRYAPADLTLNPADYGFRVERVYEAVDSAGDVRRLPDGSWQIRAGARVRVRLTMIAPAQRVHVALADPLPAGLEPMNPELQGTGSAPPEPSPLEQTSEQWWRRSWFEHQNLRDERAEAFRSLLPAGVYTYTYLARATTPGEFVVAPTHAEEMYSPETFGRGGTDRVIVVPEPPR